MVEPCLMASQGCPPAGLGATFNPEQQASIRVPEGLHHFLPCYGVNQEQINSHSFNLSLQQKEEWTRTSGLLDTDLCARTDAVPKKTALIDFQESHPDSVSFSSGIVERCALREKIMKSLASGLYEEQDVLDLSKLYYLMGPLSLFADLSQLNLIFPSNELCFYGPCLGMVGDGNTCPEKACFADIQLQYNTATAMSNVVSSISEFYSPKNTNKSSKQTMLVPYFERRKRPCAKNDASKPATESVKSSKSVDKVSEKAPLKKKASTRTSKARVIYSNSYLHACESLLSIIAGRNQQCRILSLKRSSPHLPQFLTQCSATIAGTGIALVLSVLCRVACGMFSFSASKLLSTGVGLGLVWLSWAVNRLRDTIVFMSKTSSKVGEKEEEMMTHLDRNLKDIYFRAATLMLLAVLVVA